MPHLKRNANPTKKRTKLLEQLDKALGLSGEEGALIGKQMLEAETGVNPNPAPRSSPVARHRRPPSDGTTMPARPAFPTYEPPQSMPWWKKAIGIGMGAAAGDNAGKVYEGLITKPEERAKEDYNRRLGQYQSEMDLFRDAREDVRREREEGRQWSQFEFQQEHGAETLDEQRRQRDQEREYRKADLRLRAAQGDQHAELEIEKMDRADARERAEREELRPGRQAQAGMYREHAGLYGRTPRMGATAGGGSQLNSIQRWYYTERRKIEEKYSKPDVTGQGTGVDASGRPTPGSLESKQRELASLEAAYKKQLQNSSGAREGYNIETGELEPY